MNHQINSVNQTFKSPLHVKHAMLQRTGQSKWRSKCPVCQTGVLLVQRATANHMLLGQDNCINCGQRFIYDDIEDMRDHDIVEPDHHEAGMTISGVELTEAQSLTVRVALQSFGLYLEDQLKKDGRDALWEAYLKRIVEINGLIMRSAR